MIKIEIVKDFRKLRDEKTGKLLNQYKRRLPLSICPYCGKGGNSFDEASFTILGYGQWEVQDHYLLAPTKDRIVFTKCNNCKSISWAHSFSEYEYTFYIENNKESLITYDNIVEDRNLLNKELIENLSPEERSKKVSYMKCIKVIFDSETDENFYYKNFNDEALYTFEEYQIEINKINKLIEEYLNEN